MDGDLGLELADAPLGRRQLSSLGRTHARDLPSIDLLLPSPDVDRLGADAQVTGEIRRLAAGDQQIEYATTELRRVTPSSHCCLLFGTAA
jgi:hypothetical protein